MNDSDKFDNLVGASLTDSLEVLSQYISNWRGAAERHEALKRIYNFLAEASTKERADFVKWYVSKYGRLELPQYVGMKAELSGVVFGEGATEINWEEADLRGSILKDAVLTGVNFLRADLQDADLTRAKLGYANLMHANLQEAKLEQADLRFANLAEANMQNARLRSTQLNCAALVGVNLQDAALVSIKFYNANLREADFQGAELVSVDFSSADLSGAKLQGVDLTDKCNLTHVYLCGARLESTKMRVDQLGGEIAEERFGRYEEARLGYVALKRNFGDLGDYDGASWAYRKERRMEKKAALQKARAAFLNCQPQEVLKNGLKVIIDTGVELVCDYGENIMRVFISLLLVWLGFAGFYWRFSGIEHAGEALEPTPLTFVDALAFSLGTMTTLEPPGLAVPPTPAMQFIRPVETLLAIFLTGLLGFVAANRIRRP